MRMGFQSLLHIQAIKSFVRWYVSRFMASDYIHKQDIQGELYAARREEAARQERLRIEELDHLREMKDLERHIEVSSLKSDVIRLETMLDEAYARMRYTEKVELKNKRMAKENFSVSIELRHYVNQLTEMFAQAMGKISGIEDKARLQMREIEENKESA